MALDFTVLGKNGSPEKTVSPGVDLHHALMKIAASLDAAHVQRFVDYYEDVEITFPELPSLADEVLELRSRIDYGEMRRFLEDLEGLISHAMAEQKPLHAIAD